ncbi:lung adenoma susceptibility protein 2 [Hippocampus zosterae]|uniref:lung adenoma susceptibility protein 2 n=1 Tax=Hippocampus zosterae TaxID=109293 RepID=UPI00223CDA66|nr:lung adenoma susceptibility protein 2 [Hippocampus zosterae]
MDSTSPLSDIVSPESTVTTLLSSSGHFRSSLTSPGFNTTFRYRNKEYESASAALDAYIADFDRRRNVESPGSLVLPQSPLSTPRRAPMSARRNKCVLREALTDREVDFLTLPVSSLRHRDNRDRLSMTTDELLSIPRDGSMPVTHTTAFIQGRSSQSAASQSRGSSKPGYGAGDNVSQPHLRSNCRSCRWNVEPEISTLKQDVPFVRCLTCAHRAARAEQESLSSSPHLQRGDNENKAELGRSGISSVPAWIQDCDLVGPLNLSEVYFSDKLGGVPPVASISTAPSWFANTKDEAGRTPDQGDTQQCLKDLRIQFAEEISLMASERKSSDFSESLVRDHRLESLIHKADEVLNSLSRSFARRESLADSELNSEEMKLCSTSRGPPAPTESEGAAEVIEGALPEESEQDFSRDGSSVCKQPGPLEALKQMMFRLQAVEAELHRQQHLPIAQPCGKDTQRRPKSEAEPDLSAAPSLQRALHHLNRLKLLLEEPREKHEEEEDIDEGQYSSSSAGFPFNMETVTDGDVSSQCHR